MESPVLGCCDCAEETRILHIHQSLPCFAGNSLITISAPPAASGLSGDGQVAGAVQTEAGRQLQGSSSGKKSKTHPREDFCSHFSALEMPLTNVRTAENKKSLLTEWRSY